MQLSENEIECIKFFPRMENLLSIYLFDYFEMNIFRRTGLSKKIAVVISGKTYSAAVMFINYLYTIFQI